MTIIEKLIKAGRSDLAEKLRSTWKNSVMFRDNIAFKDGEVPVGTSKIFGFPDLPPEIAYPELSGFHWSNKHGESGTVPRSSMQLIAQINLYELAKSGADIEKVLPETGMLYIFSCAYYGSEIDLELLPSFNPIEDIYYDITSVDDPELTQKVKVIYWDGDISTLRKTQPPSPFYGGLSYPEMTKERPVTFYSQDNYDVMLLDDDTNDELLSILKWDYDDLIPENEFTEKLLGVPWTVRKMHYMAESEVCLFQYRDFRYGYLSDYLAIDKASLRNKAFSDARLLEDQG